MSHTAEVSCLGGYRANSTTVTGDEEDLPFTDMVLKFAEKVSCMNTLTMLMTGDYFRPLTLLTRVS